ncbi:MAG: tetratricopeptide repeat protein [Bacteroidota bacterium]
MIQPLRQFLILVFLALLFTSCTREETPVERRAREVFAKAKDALVRGDHQESKRLLREAVSLYQHLDDAARLAETSLLLGETHSAAAEFDAAFSLFARARELYQQVSDKGGLRATVFALAATHRLRGEDRQAYTILTEELRLEEALGDVYGVRQLKWALIPVCRSLADEEAERRLLEELLNDYNASRDNAMLAKVHFELGKSSLHRSSYSEAVKHFSAALALARQAKDSLLSIQIYLHLAIAHDRLGMQAEAFQMFTEGIRRSDKTKGAESLREEMLLRVGNIYLRQGRYDQAHKFLNAALRSAIKTQNKLLEAYALLQLGHCKSAMPGGDADAQNAFRAGADLASHVGLPAANAYAHMCLGYAALKHNHLNRALEHFHNAVASYDSSLGRRDDYDMFVDCENSFYQNRQTSPYDAMIELLFQLGKTDEAFLFAEKKNRASLSHAFGTMDIKTRDVQLNKSLQTYAHARGNYIGAERQLANVFVVRAESRTLATDVQRSLDRSSARMRELGDSLASTNTQLRAALSQKVSTLSETQRRVPEGSALVAYIPTKQSLHILVVSRTKTTVQISAIGKTALHQLMIEYAEALRQSNVEAEQRSESSLQQRVRDLSSRLYAVFMRPVELNDENSVRLLVVMPAELPFIPLHALQQEGRLGEFAIQRYSLHYLPDADALTLKGARMNSYPVVIGFGNQGRTSVDVEYEVRDAKAFYRDAKLYFNRDATLARLQHESGDILHSAFEIHYRKEQPENSFFVLADGTGYASARYYRLGELFAVASFSTVMISNLSNAELNPIVPRIFLMNGSAEVLVNGYVPLRKAKKFFNQMFYTHLLAGATTEVAYRNALLEMIKNAEYSAPNMWAGFFLW